MMFASDASYAELKKSQHNERHEKYQFPRTKFERARYPFYVLCTLEVVMHCNVLGSI